MTDLFLRILQMGATASVVLVVSLLLRFTILRKAPKWLCVVLWGLAAIRLVCPVALESTVSLMPREVSNVVSLADTSSAPESTYSAIVPETASQPAADRTQIYPLLARFYGLGVTGMLAYMLVSTLRVRRLVRNAVRLRDNVYVCAGLPSPFVAGLIHPRIYLRDTSDDVPYILAHERTHIRRLDPLWKTVGFAILAFYWFHPLVWLWYRLLCRDIELACDEKTVRTLSATERADYSAVLLQYSTSRCAGLRLCFGDAGVKTRIRAVLSHKKPTLWCLLAAILACIALTACFLTDPLSNPVRLYRITEAEWPPEDSDTIYTFSNSPPVTAYSFDDATIICAFRSVPGDNDGARFTADNLVYWPDNNGISSSGYTLYLRNDSPENVRMTIYRTSDDKRLTSVTIAAGESAAYVLECSSIWYMGIQSPSNTAPAFYCAVQPRE